MRVGMGYDVHKLVENRKLILGGVEIPYEYGLLGHSDADVLVHAIMDALLGAAALRDIGRHFPDNDPAYEGADSIELLKKVGEMLEERMYLIENIDATVIAQKPKLLPYIDTMVKNVNPEIQAFPGRVVSGDQFISDKAKKEWLIEQFSASCTEMEGAAIAQAAYLNGIPFLIIRAISDKADQKPQLFTKRHSRQKVH